MPRTIDTAALAAPSAPSLVEPAKLWKRRAMRSSVTSTPGDVPGPRRHDNETARRVFEGLPRDYDRLAEWLSFGQNARWRAALVDAVSNGRPSLVLDVATGTAGVALAIHSRTGASVLGVDLDAGMLRAGAENVQRSAVGNVALARSRAEQLPLADESVDACSFTYLLRYVDDPAATIGELVRVVRRGGVIANLEFLVPPRPLWHGAWWLYTRAALPLAGLATGGTPWYRVGRFLGPSISEHYRRYPLEWTVRAWEDAGIEEVTVRRMSLGGGLVMWGRRR
ncbi:MAG: class I SAM-dependent methyltransferase [Acidimicrobiales bacterium]